MGSDLLRTGTVRDVHEATATAQARAAADALHEVEQRFPEESFDRPALGCGDELLTSSAQVGKTYGCRWARDSGPLLRVP